MKHKLLFSILLLSTMTTTVFAESPAVESDKGAIVATVNGQPIHETTLDAYMEILKKSGKTDKRVAVDDLVATELALQEAKKTDILSRPDIANRIEDFKRNLLLTTWTKEKVDSFKISDDEIKAAYDERVKELASKEYNARHILVKTEDEANAVLKLVEAKDADFAEIAKEKSTGPSSSNGGSLGWFKAQTMVPTFADAVKTMKKGEISKPVKTQFGYHVIKLEDTRDAKVASFESIKPQLTRVLSQQKMLTFIAEQKKSAKIEITLPEEKAEVKSTPTAKENAIKELKKMTK